MSNIASKTTRRNLLKNAAGAAAVVTGAAALTPSASAAPAPATPSAKNQKQGWPKPKEGEKRLFSSAVSYNGMLFLAGVGAHFQGTIQEHTKHVLDALEQQLIEAGSSMEKVLKVNVYLNDLKDYQAMNDTYMGRFGGIPPVRTTVAPAGGVPGNSLVEMDCIAYI
jgi:enamine deaminase RidA (YjgF/YER057c/UK114 family)